MLLNYRFNAHLFTTTLNRTQEWILTMFRQLSHLDMQIHWEAVVAEEVTTGECRALIAACVIETDWTLTVIHFWPAL